MARMISHHKMGDNGNGPDRVIEYILTHKHHKRHRNHHFNPWLSRSLLPDEDLGMTKFQPKNYVTGRWYLPSRLTSRATSSGQRPDGYCEVSKINRCMIYKPILRRPHSQGFGRVARWQPAKVGIFSKFISKQLSFKYNLLMCKVNTSKDPFSQCENLQNLQGIHIQVKSEYVGTIDNK